MEIEEADRAISFLDQYSDTIEEMVLSFAPVYQVEPSSIIQWTD